MQRTTSATSNEQILQQVTSDFTTSNEQRVNFNEQGAASEKLRLGGSMVKHLNGWEMYKKMNANCKVFVKTFSGAKTTSMNDYVKPSERSSPS